MSLTVIVIIVVVVLALVLVTLQWRKRSAAAKAYRPERKAEILRQRADAHRANAQQEEDRKLGGRN